MTVATNTPFDQYIASNGQTVFNYTFEIVEQTDLLVYQRLNTNPANDLVDLLTLNVDYIVTGAGNEGGGTIILNTGAALNDIVTLKQNVPVGRDTSFTPGGILRAQDLNSEFDNQTLIEQVTRFNEQNRMPRYWDSEIVVPFVDTILPKLAAQQVWRMNENGDAIEAYTIDNIPAPSNSFFITYGDDPSLENEQNLALLGDGLLKQTVSGGLATLALAIPGVDYLDPGVPLGTMAYQNANNVSITGGFAALTAGSVINSPVAGTDLVNKSYADSIAAGFIFKASCVLATTANLSTTYNNGASGVGATLTATGNGVLTIDGENPTLNSRVLVKNQNTTYQNGVYIASDLGSVGTPYILTRATDFDSPAEIVPGSIIFIQDGATQADTSFVETEIVISVGTSPILFTQFSQQYPLSMGNGGTSNSLVPVNNSLVYSNASQMVLLPPQNSRVLTSSVAGLPTWATTLPANLTITTPLIDSIKDTNGNTIVTLSPVASAVNFITITNSATGINPGISVAGSDPDIAFNISAKGLFGIRFLTTALTQPMGITSGTAGQHTTVFNMANTAATRNVTFQDADGTLAYLADRDWVFIQQQTANNTSALMDFTNLTGYRNYKFVFNCFTPATNGASIGALASINNGSSYLTSSGDYFYQLVGANTSSITTAAVTTNTYIPISNGTLGSNSNGGINGEILFIGFSGSSLRKGFISHTHFFNGSSVQQLIDCYGQIVNVTANPVNAIRFSTTAGNLFGGTVTLYGMK